jgi:DNA-binding IclR family transcriptional regulator
VRSVDRTLALIELFAECGTALTLTEAAHKLAIPVSSCHNLFRSLCDKGYLYEVRARTFYPTSRLLHQANAIADSDPVRFTLRQDLEILRDQTGETIFLAKLVVDRAVIIDVVSSQQRIRYSAVAGDFRPLFNSAAGKALLGALDEEKRERAVARLKLVPTTANTITDKGLLLRDIRVGVGRGWFSTRGEGVIDVVSIARPVQIGGSVYAVAIAGPMHRMERMKTALAVRLVARCEQMMSSARLAPTAGARRKLSVK